MDVLSRVQQFNGVLSEVGCQITIRKEESAEKMLQSQWRTLLVITEKNGRFETQTPARLSFSKREKY